MSDQGRASGHGLVWVSRHYSESIIVSWSAENGPGDYEDGFYGEKYPALAVPADLFAVYDSTQRAALEAEQALDAWISEHDDWNGDAR